MKTLKAVVAKYNSISLILRILVGLAVGVALTRYKKDIYTLS